MVRETEASEARGGRWPWAGGRRQRKAGGGQQAQEADAGCWGAGDAGVLADRISLCSGLYTEKPAADAKFCVLRAEGKTWRTPQLSPPRDPAGGGRFEVPGTVKW